MGECGGEHYHFTKRSKDWTLKTNRGFLAMMTMTQRTTTS